MPAKPLTVQNNQALSRLDYSLENFSKFAGTLPCIILLCVLLLACVRSLDSKIDQSRQSDHGRILSRNTSLYLQEQRMVTIVHEQRATIFRDS